VAGALTTLHRMLEAGGLVGVQVVATLHGHFANMLALDGGAAATEREAAEILGISPYPAKKALEQSRRLGSARIAQGITWLLAADLDLKGASGLPPEVIVEILVARLARQTRPRTAGSRGR
jgi:DNA polymerase-3 subunit delta